MGAAASWNSWSNGDRFIYKSSFGAACAARYMANTCVKGFDPFYSLLFAGSGVFSRVYPAIQPRLFSG